MQKIVYTDPVTGNVAIIHPTPEWLSVEGNTIEICAEQSVPSGIEYRIVEEEDIPVDRTFRNAWTDEYDTPTIDVDIEKAKGIHLDNLRIKRNEILSKLDKDYMLSLENGLTDKGKQIAGRKQKLRDMPIKALEEIASINSVEDLKQYVPSILEED